MDSNTAVGSEMVCLMPAAELQRVLLYQNAPIAESNGMWA